MFSFVYFDVGGVLIKDISDQKSWDEMKKAIGIPRNKFDEFDIFWDDQEYFLNLTTEIDSLIPLIERKFGVTFPKNYSLLTEFLNRFKQNTSIWPIVNRAKKCCSVGLLTNMYPGMLDGIESAGIMPKVNWDIIVDSSKVGFQKPEREIFSLAQKLAKVKNKEVLFVDNSHKNIEGARKFGWQVYLYNPLKLKESNSGLLEILRKGCELCRGEDSSLY